MIDKIGIKVDVQFPSASELQKQFNEQWQKVKDKYEALIKVRADANSIRTMRSQIQKALNEKIYDVKIGTTDAVRSINKVKSGISDIDKLVNKARTVKIDFKLTDVDKTLKQILEANQKIEKAKNSQIEAEKKNESALKNTNRELNKQYDKITKIAKLNKETGRLEHTSTTSTKKEGNVTYFKTENANGEIISEREITNRLSLLKDIQKEMKAINDAEKKLITATGKEVEILQNEIYARKEQFKILTEQYSEQYKFNALNEEQLVAHKKQLEYQLKLKQATKEERDLKRQLKEEEREISSVLSEVISYENKKSELLRRMVGLSNEEKAVLKEQYKYIQEQQSSLMRKYDLENKLTNVQKEELNHVKAINKFKLEQVMLQDKLRAKSEKEQQVQKEILSQLKEVHKLKQQIANIESKSVKSTQEEQNLQVLKEALKYEERLLQATIEEVQKKGLLTKELENQVALEKQLNSQEINRINNINKVKSVQSETNEMLKEYMDITRQIGQLQRDMIFAGMREEQLISKQVDELKEKQRLIKESLEAENRLTDAQRKEIANIQKAQAEQNKLNSARAEARQKDQQYNNSAEIINPYSFYQNTKQAGTEVIQTIAELDEAFMRVKKVAEATEEQFKSFADESYDTASSLGVSASEYMLAVEKWVTAGKTLGEARELAQTSLVGAFVGNIEPDLMVKWMSVPLNAFKSSALEANDIINTMNEVSNNHAVEMEELGKAYMRSAGAVQTAGVTFNELTGFITAAQEATRMGGERIGTSLKTISVNYNNIKGKITTGEKKKFDMLKSYGLDLDKTESLYEALEQLVKIKDKLKPVELNEILYRLAGKEHQNILTGIINEWETAQEAIAESAEQMGLGEEGSAFIEHGKQADSVRFKLAELKNAWDELMYTIGGGQHGAVLILDKLVKTFQALTEMAKNEDLRTIAKYLFMGVGLRAGWNMIARIFSALKGGMGKTKKDLLEIKLLAKEIRAIIGSTRYNVGTIQKGNLVNTGKNTTVVGKTGGKDSSKNGGNTVIGKVGNNKDNKNSKDKDDDDENNKNNKSHTVWFSGTSSVIKDKSSKRKSSKTMSDIDDMFDTKPNKATGKFLKFGGKALSVIPVVGDIAIASALIAEMAGINLSGAIGGLVSKLGLFKDTAEEEAQKIEKKQKELSKNNDTLNGTSKKNKKSFNDILETHEKISKRDMNKDKKGVQAYYTEEEYVKLRDSFNELAESNGLEIRIDHNDFEYINEQIEKLNEKLKELDKNSKIELVANLTEETGKGKNKKSNYERWKEHGDNLKELNRKKENVEGQLAVKESVKESLEKSGKTNTGEYQYLIREIEELTNRKDVLNQKIAEEQKIFDALNNTMIQTGSELGKMGENITSLGLSNEDAKISIDSITEAYKKNVSEQATLIAVKNALSNGLDIERGQWEQLLQMLPDNVELKDELLHKDFELLSSNKDMINAYLERTEAAINSYEQEISSSKKAVGALGDMTGEGYLFVRALERIQEEAIKSGVKVEDLQRYINGLKGKDIKITVTKIQKEIYQGSSTPKTHVAKGSVGGRVAESVSANTIPSYNSISTTSQSVSSSSSIGEFATSSPQITSVDNATSTKKTNKKTNSKSSTTNNAKVDSDIWRYWKTELKIDKLDQSIDNLRHSMDTNSDNQDKLIKLYQIQNKQYEQQKSNYNTLKKQKQSEMNGVLASLRKLGFKTKGNDITNLGYAKNLKGKNAEKAEDLLNTWRNLTSDLMSIADSIAGINKNIMDNKEAIREAKAEKEAKSIENKIKSSNKVLNNISTSDSIMAQLEKFIGENDFELGLVQNEVAMNKARANINSLISQFNSLYKTKITYKEENAEALMQQLQAIGDEILSQSDAIIEYQNAINEIEFNRATKDLEKFTNTVEKNNNRISNTIQNLQEGLLNGTSVKDLKSATAVSLNLDRDNDYQKMAKQRISLEKDVQYALNEFAKTNVNREKNVVNTKLEINSKYYSTLLNMQKKFSKGESISYDKIDTTIKNLESYADNVSNKYNLDDNLKSKFDSIKKEQNKLLDNYTENMKNAKNYQEEKKITDKYILDSLNLQKNYYNAIIYGNENAIKNLKDKLSDVNLSDSLRNNIEEQIVAYEEGIIEAQNNIKSVVEETFSYQKQMIDDSLKKYNDYAESIDYVQNIIGSISGNNYEALHKIYDASLMNQKAYNNAILENIKNLQLQKAKVKEGTYEWNLYTSQIEDLNSQLKESNISILEISKARLENAFDGIFYGLEDKSRNLKKGIDEVLFNTWYSKWERDNDLWMKGVEKEIALENLYKRLADLETDAFDRKMKALDKQEKLSRSEIDYLNKQIDLYEAEKKLQNLENERTVQYLKQKEDGTWDWVYEADQTMLDEARKEYNDARLELENSINDGLSMYRDSLQDILEDALDGKYKTSDALNNAIKELNNNFGYLIDNTDVIPEELRKTLDGNILDLIRAYEDNLKEISDTIGDVDTNVEKFVRLNPSNSVSNSIDDSKVLIDLKNAINDIKNKIVGSSNSSLSNSTTSKHVSVSEKVVSEDKSISITLEKLEFPNVKNADGIEEAILSLPQIALQKSKSKL